MTINKKYLIISTLYSTVSILSFFILFIILSNNYIINQRLIGIYTIFLLFITVVTFHFLKIKFLSISWTFVILNFIFHLGQPIIKFISPNYIFKFDVSFVVSRDTYIFSLLYSLLFIISMVFGILLLRIFSAKKIYSIGCIDKNIDQLIEFHNNIFKLGTIIFIFTFPIEAYLLLNRLGTAIQSGYLSTFEFEIGGFTSIIATFSLVGFVLMIIGSKFNYRWAKLLLFSYSVFYGVAMLSGGRMWQILKLLIVFLYFIKTFKVNFKIKNIILLLIFSYLLAGFLAAIADFRSYDFSNNTYIIEIMIAIFENNPFLEILDEFGGTIYTLSLVIEKTNIINNYSYGKQFISGIVNIFPNITGLIYELSNQSNFVLQLNVPNIGGSFIGEMYYSFGIFGILIVPFIGIFIQLLSNKIDKCMFTYNYQFIAYTILFQYSFISWVRGSSQVFYRNTFYGIIFLYLIKNIVFPQKNLRLKYTPYLESKIS